LLKLLREDGRLDPHPNVRAMNETEFHLLMDAISVLAMQRDMQQHLRQVDMWKHLRQLAEVEASVKQGTEDEAIRASIMRVVTCIALHPCHQDSIGTFTYPPREELVKYLQKQLADTNDMIVKSLASLTLTAIDTEKLKGHVADLQPMIFTLLDWWFTNTTSLFDKYKRAEELGKEIPENFLVSQEQNLVERVAASAEDPRFKPEDLRLAKFELVSEPRETPLSVIQSLPYCAPFENVVILSMMARLALEPKFKTVLMDRPAFVPALLNAISNGVWPEAREAAGIIANLCWGVDHVVCWLKFDSATSVAVDSANVLHPRRTFQPPRPVELGRGLYGSVWGQEFVQESCILLHPDGFSTEKVPSTLAFASPSDTFRTTSVPYQGLDPEVTHFMAGEEGREMKRAALSIVCWFHWPLCEESANQHDHVLLQALAQEDNSKRTQIRVNKDERWVICDDRGTKWRIRTPKILAGWHMMTLVSEAEGTRFHIDDEWSHTIKNAWILNSFFVLGNEASPQNDPGKKPFGLIADFRIYARCLNPQEIAWMASVTGEMIEKGDRRFPDWPARELCHPAVIDALVRGLAVPDSCVSCLRALGSLATFLPMRSYIYGVCGNQVMGLLDSPLPMVQRLACRAMANMR